MARISGVDLPNNKRVEIALTYIFGIGRTKALKIREEAGLDSQIRMKDLTEEDIAKIRQILDDGYKVEGDLRREKAMDLKRLMDIGCYRGLRHRKGLPVRGQRTHTNARTRRGKRKSAVKKKVKS